MRDLRFVLRIFRYLRTQEVQRRSEKLHPVTATGLVNKVSDEFEASDWPASRRHRKFSVC